MKIELSAPGATYNTRYAPLAVLLAGYRKENTLQPFSNLKIPMKTRDFAPSDKLLQTLISILAGCATISEVNVRLRSEDRLAQICGWPRFADQSTLSRTLDALTQKQIEHLRQVGHTIWWRQSPLRQRDWRPYLWLDFDLSGLPSSGNAEKSEKGYFGGKKT